MRYVPEDGEQDASLACDQCGAHPLAVDGAAAGDACPFHAVPEPYSSCDGVLRVAVQEGEARA